VQQIGAAREGNTHQVNPAAQAYVTKLCPTRKDGVVNDHASVALNALTVKLPFENTILDYQDRVEIGLRKVSRCNATADQLHHLVERASLQINPGDNAIVQDDGLVDAAHVLTAEPATDDQWIKVKQTGDSHALNVLSNAQALKHLTRRYDPESVCWYHFRF